MPARMTELRGGSLTRSLSLCLRSTMATRRLTKERRRSITKRRVCSGTLTIGSAKVAGVVEMPSIQASVQPLRLVTSPSRDGCVATAFLNRVMYLGHHAFSTKELAEACKYDALKEDLGYA